MITQITQPAAPLVDIAAMRRYLSAEDEHDTTIMELCSSARAWIENYCCFEFGVRQTQLIIDNLSDVIDLGRFGLRPVNSIDQIEYLNDLNAWEVIPPEVYRFDGLSRIERVGTWPVIQWRTGGVRIRAQTGAITVPEDVKTACRLYVLGLWDDVDQSAAVAAHLAPWVYR